MSDEGPPGFRGYPKHKKKALHPAVGEAIASRIAQAGGVGAKNAFTRVTAERDEARTQLAEARAELAETRRQLEALCKSLRIPVYGQDDFECWSQEHDTAERFLLKLKPYMGE